MNTLHLLCLALACFVELCASREGQLEFPIAAEETKSRSTFTSSTLMQETQAGFDERVKTDVAPESADAELRASDLHGRQSEHLRPKTQLGNEADESSIQETFQKSSGRIKDRKKRVSVNPIDETSNVPVSLGCHEVDNTTMQRVLQGSEDMLTVEVCIKECWSTDHKYAMIKRGRQCFCKADLIGVHTDFTNSYSCNAPCPGNVMQFCGGSDESHYSIYSTGLVPIPGDLKLPYRVVMRVYKGCYPHPSFDSPFGVLFRTGRLFTSACLVRCFQLKYAYAMLWVGDFCFCDNNMPEGSDDGDSKCQVPCRGHTAMKCGGVGDVAVFETGYSLKETPVAQEDFVYDAWMEIKFEDDFMDNKHLESVTNDRRTTMVKGQVKRNDGGKVEGEDARGEARRRRRRQLPEPRRDWNRSKAAHAWDYGQLQARIMDQGQAISMGRSEQEHLQILFGSVTSILVLLAAVILAFNFYRWQQYKARLTEEQARRGRFDTDTPPTCVLPSRDASQRSPWDDSPNSSRPQTHTSRV